MSATTWFLAGLATGFLLPAAYFSLLLVRAETRDEP
jgi:hypothetical protein